ncbi:ATP-grasp fold amidoligase family protein [Halovenus sp. HT40]|uniref:ATP-grasp fold amidoligase family protein n=1 Tax=Halovenus sp. HT40 TaxID=3126691 RepID=UPI00300E8D13
MNWIQKTSAYQIYEERGIKALLSIAWAHTLVHTLAGRAAAAVIGQPIHEQLVAFPSLGYWPKIKYPRSFNEKILYRKIFTDRDLFVTVSDKYQVRNYVEKQIDSDILTDLYYVTEDPETIPFEELPDQFVLKGTHGSSMNWIVQDKTAVDYESLIAESKQWLEREYGANNLEYWYTDITPQIIVEEYIESSQGKAPRDYKFYVFNGQVEYIHVDHGRFSDHTRRFYDSDWNPQDFTRIYPLGPVIDEPSDFDRMIEVAETLGEPFEFMRVDLYNPEPGSIVFGEMTVAPGTGRGRFQPINIDFEFGSHWEIEDSNPLHQSQ